MAIRIGSTAKKRAVFAVAKLQTTATFRAVAKGVLKRMLVSTKKGMINF